ncbi:hypothetical protein Psed_0111 [Pseudonocardia dioxanivorans CB1190]|uniref:Low molecular weight protein antigen 6 PH domain-containing protein n=1 Tax=Pseudonocardia dioxanivorans (strain ATCC 55486 / DSM 44775 / JCM 13855 / CB1190) TaxID=675635 RepID=F4CQF0_PSEUX|nr:PH domain-containing protein [Pseudonocardia dioxanivorans]AEA22388.1 hypothetical protein Psed_0111 [Pseudonocardia dioxanivorans CB1190]
MIFDDAESPGPDGESPARSWSPQAGLVVLAWIGAAGAGAWLAVLVVTHGDPAGRLFAAVLGLVLLVGAVWGTRARPRLAVGPEGLTVRGGFSRSRTHPWGQVTDVRVLQTRRFGRTVATLAVDVRDESGPGADPDAAERLLVFGRLDLGADPVDVAATVLAARR